VLATLQRISTDIEALDAANNPSPLPHLRDALHDGPLPAVPSAEGEDEAAAAAGDLPAGEPESVSLADAVDFAAGSDGGHHGRR